MSLVMSVDAESTVRGPWVPTGHTEVDRQHRELFDLIDRARSLIVHPGASTTAPVSARLCATIAVFTDRALAHFAYEEALMRQSAFPGAARHMASHRAMANGIVQLSEALEAGQSPERLLNEVLDCWLRHHVGNMDLELVRHTRTCQPPVTA